MDLTGIDAMAQLVSQGGFGGSGVLAPLFNLLSELGAPMNNGGVRHTSLGTETPLNRAQVALSWWLYRTDPHVGVMRHELIQAARFDEPVFQREDAPVPMSRDYKWYYAEYLVPFAHDFIDAHNVVGVVPIVTRVCPHTRRPYPAVPKPELYEICEVTSRTHAPAGDFVFAWLDPLRRTPPRRDASVYIWKHTSERPCGGMLTTRFARCVPEILRTMYVKTSYSKVCTRVGNAVGYLERDPLPAPATPQQLQAPTNAATDQPVRPKVPAIPGTIGQVDTYDAAAFRAMPIAGAIVARCNVRAARRVPYAKAHDTTGITFTVDRRATCDERRDADAFIAGEDGRTNATGTEETTEQRYIALDPGVHVRTLPGIDAARIFDYPETTRETRHLLCLAMGVPISMMEPASAHTLRETHRIHRGVFTESVRGYQHGVSKVLTYLHAWYFGEDDAMTQLLQKFAQRYAAAHGRSAAWAARHVFMVPAHTDYVRYLVHGDTTLDDDEKIRLLYPKADDVATTDGPTPTHDDVVRFVHNELTGGAVTVSPLVISFEPIVTPDKIDIMNQARLRGVKEVTFDRVCDAYLSLLGIPKSDRGTSPTGRADPLTFEQACAFAGINVPTSAADSAVDDKGHARPKKRPTKRAHDDDDDDDNDTESDDDSAHTTKKRKPKGNKRQRITE